MTIIENAKVYDVKCCHFKTINHSNSYNLIYSECEHSGYDEIHLICTIVSDSENVIKFDKDIRSFICNTLSRHMSETGRGIYFSINCVGDKNEYLVWKFMRWIKFYNKTQQTLDIRLTVNTNLDNTIRFFEFFIKL